MQCTCMYIEHVHRYTHHHQSKDTLKIHKFMSLPKHPLFTFYMAEMSYIQPKQAQVNQNTCRSELTNDQVQVDQKYVHVRVNFKLKVLSIVNFRWRQSAVSNQILIFYTECRFLFNLGYKIT